MFEVFSGSYVIMTGAIGGAGWYGYRLSTRPDSAYLYSLTVIQREVLTELFLQL
jgi:hypothetical protein